MAVLVMWLAAAAVAAAAATTAGALAAGTADFWFPRPGDPQSISKDKPAEPKGIPLEILQKLSDVGNVTFFLNNFVDPNSLASLHGDDTLGNRFGGEERKSVQRAKPALCQPQLEVVSLTSTTTDPTIYYYPTCTRVERCGGCCGSGLMSCQPVETEIVNFQVIVTQYTGRSHMEFKGHEIIPVEKHTKCQCDCKIKEKSESLDLQENSTTRDCKQFQEYRKTECACVCVNNDEQEKCHTQSDIKIWDVSTCSCQCKEVRACSSSYYYDQDVCRCLEVPARNRRGDRQEGR